MSIDVLIIARGRGWGHASRCRAVGSALERRGMRIAHASYADGVEYLRRHGDVIDMGLELEAEHTAKEAPRIQEAIEKSKPKVVVADEVFLAPYIATAFHTLSSLLL